MSNVCVVCGNPVVHEDLCADSDIYAEACERADICGMEALTDTQQTMVNMHVCSDECYYALD